MCHFEKKVAEYETKVLQRDTVNIFGNPKFTSICLVDKDLIHATTNNEIYQLHLQRDGLGIYAEASLVTKAPSEGLSGICYLENHIFLDSNTRILKYSLPGRTFEEILSKQDTGFQPYQVRSKGKDILFSEPEARKVFTYDIFTKNLRILAGNRNNELTDGSSLDASFRQPCGLAVEFDNVTCY